MMGLFDKPKVNGGIATYGRGAKRTAKDVRFELLSPIGLRRMAQASHEGAEKYGSFNVEKGLPISVFLNHALSHIYAYREGDRSEDHLSHAGWNLMFACHSEEVWPELNNDLRQPGCKPPPAAKAQEVTE
jgi:hypothetical protein